MFSRGYEFAEPVLGTAQACRFSVVDGKVMLPFNAVNGIVDGLFASNAIGSGAMSAIGLNVLIV